MVYFLLVFLIQIAALQYKALKRRRKNLRKMAYAAITSFMSTISVSLGHQSLHLTVDAKELMEVLYTKLDSLRTLVEETDKIIGDREALKTLEAQTMEVAYIADDKVESELRDLALWKIQVSQGRSTCECLQQVIENVDSKAEEWIEMKNMYRNIIDLKPQTFDLGDFNSQNVLDSKNIMVGYDDELEMMLDQLVRGFGEDKVISLVGMGGIGKTTFATRIFNEPVVMSHFDVRAKVNVSQEYQVRNLYLSLLGFTASRSEGFDGKDDGELAGLLQKSLKRRRYLVIVDDIWTTETWDDIRLCFPFNNNGSRILLTTRNTEVAEYSSSGMPPYQMRLLSFDECWDLLYQKVSLNECLTPEFEEIGKEVVRQCQGLPLAVAVMAGVLLRLGKSLDAWKKLVEDVNFLRSTDLDLYCSRVLALSYYHLPHHLRACLLYFAIFKKSGDIQVSRLVRLWIAEGFVKVKRDESLEMAAEKCLKDLIDRSLVSVNSWSFYGKFKSCGIHDMVYEFCLEEAQNTNFLNTVGEKDVQNLGSFSSPYSMPNILSSSYPLRISIQYAGINFHSPFGDAKVHSILYCGNIFSTEELRFSWFKQVRVLDLISVILDHLPNDIRGLFRLRYLSFTVNRPFNTKVIANLKNLQSLIIQYVWDGNFLKDHIWGLSQLRYLKSSRIYLGNKSVVLLKHLHTLSGLDPACCQSISVLNGISNVKRLQIRGDESDYLHHRGFQYCNLSHLHQLESLSVVVEETKHEMLYMQATLRLPRASAFPQNLKKLTLQATLLPWKQMTNTVSKLPKLEALKLERYACRGIKWEIIEDGFPQLKLLLLDCTDLVSWKSNSDHFPCLERLVLIDCYSLISIPRDFADITTLQLIELDMCKCSVVNSAKQIQQEVGDNVFEVRVKNPIYQEEEEEEEAVAAASSRRRRSSSSSDTTNSPIQIEEDDGEDDDREGDISILARSWRQRLRSSRKKSNISEEEEEAAATQQMRKMMEEKMKKQQQLCRLRKMRHMMEKMQEQLQQLQQLQRLLPPLQRLLMPLQRLLRPLRQLRPLLQIEEDDGEDEKAFG